MSDKVIFMKALQALVVEHKAQIFYTTDDDGIHITLDGEEVFVGFIEWWSADISTANVIDGGLS